MNDFFSFGIIIYEIKTGQIAYTGKNNSEIRKSLKNRRFPDLTPLPPAWRNVIGKYWRKKYNNAEKILIELNHLSQPNPKTRVTNPLPRQLLYYSTRVSAVVVGIVVLWCLLTRK
jgi:hypothetical protein